jgi:mono/diheme cytochrome c family protein
MTPRASRGGAPRTSLSAIVLALAACTETPAPGDDARADPRDAATVALGAKVYARTCALCHGARLEGQPNWRARLPNGRLPAPPHDASGHTWHHPDRLLFAITKNGVVPPHAPAGYESDMPAFGGSLSDEEIWAALAYIKKQWSREALSARAEMLRDTGPR